MNIINCITNNISMFSVVVQTIVLFMQVIMMYKVGKMSEKATANSMDRTEIINKNQRFAEYDRDLNLILLEFWNCYREIEGFNNKIKELNKKIRNDKTAHKKVAIENMRDFLERVKLPIQFSQMRSNEYVFLINEDMKNTIWEKNWNINKLNELRVKMYKFMEKVCDLTKSQSETLDFLNSVFFENQNGRYVCKNDDNLYISNNDKFIDLQNHIDEMNENIAKIDKCVSELKLSVIGEGNEKDESNLSKMIKGIK